MVNICTVCLDHKNKKLKCIYMHFLLTLCFDIIESQEVIDFLRIDYIFAASEEKYEEIYCLL